MSNNPAFVFPPPPPPPPKAAPGQAYQNPVQPHGRARGRGSRGSFHAGSRGRGRQARSSDPRGKHPSAPWNGVVSQPQPQPSYQPAASYHQAAYGQPYHGTGTDSSSFASGHSQQNTQYHAPAGATTHLSYAITPQVAQAPLPSAFQTSYSSAQPSIHNQTPSHPPSSSSYDRTVHANADTAQSWTQLQRPPQAYQPQMTVPAYQMGSTELQFPPAFVSPGDSPYAAGFQATAASPYGYDPRTANTHIQREGRQHIPLYGAAISFGATVEPRSDAKPRLRLRDGLHEPANRPFKMRRREVVGDRGPPVRSNVVPPFLPIKPSAPLTDVNGLAKGKKRKTRKRNALGLTPRTVEREESEEDVDEEATFGDAATLESDQLRVEYKGVTSSLGSPAEIAAWIEERKKRFPTKQRIKERQEQKERQMAEARQRRDEAIRLQERARAARADQTQADVKHVAPCPSKPEKKVINKRKLLKKMKRQGKKLAVLEAELARRERKDPKIESNQGAGGLIGVEDSSPAIKVEHSEDTASVKREEHPEKLVGTREDLPQPPDSATLGTQPADELKAESQSVSNLSVAVDLESSGSSALDSGSDSGLDVSSESSSSISSPSSSSSSDDEAPTELPVLCEGPEAAAAPNLGSTSTADLANLAPSASSPICRHFARTGACTHQQRRGFCHYRHVHPSGAADAGQQPGSVAADKKANNAQSTRPPPEKPQGQGSSQGKGAQDKRGRQKPKRKSLHQRFVEQDQEQENLLVLDAIRYLGERGVLDSGDTADTTNNDSVPPLPVSPPPMTDDH